MPSYHCTAVGVKDNIIKPVARQYEEKIEAKDFLLATTYWLNKIEHLKHDGITFIEIKIVDLAAARGLFAQQGIKTMPLIDIKGNLEN